MIGKTILYLLHFFMLLRNIGDGFSHFSFNTRKSPFIEQTQLLQFRDAVMIMFYYYNVLKIEDEKNINGQMVYNRYQYQRVGNRFSSNWCISELGMGFNYTRKNLLSSPADSALALASDSYEKPPN